MDEITLPPKMARIDCCKRKVYGEVTGPGTWCYIKSNGKKSKVKQIKKEAIFKFSNKKFPDIKGYELTGQFTVNYDSYYPASVKVSDVKVSTPTEQASYQDLQVLIKALQDRVTSLEHQVSALTQKPTQNPSDVVLTPPISSIQVDDILPKLSSTSITVKKKKKRKPSTSRLEKKLAGESSIDSATQSSSSDSEDEGSIYLQRVTMFNRMPTSIVAFKELCELIASFSLDQQFLQVTDPSYQLAQQYFNGFMTMYSKECGPRLSSDGVEIFFKNRREQIRNLLESPPPSHKYFFFS